jgi:hypothetical protein
VAQVKPTLVLKVEELLHQDKVTLVVTHLQVLMVLLAVVVALGQQAEADLADQREFQVTAEQVLVLIHLGELQLAQDRM